MMVKYKVSDAAKDFSVSTKEIITILEKCTGDTKKAATTLSEHDLDVIFEVMTQNNQVKSFDEYFETGERARKAAQLAEQKDNLDTILLTEKYLKLARENLSGRYLNTMKERFSYYMSLLSGKDAPVFTMDGQFHVKVREGGAARNTEAFSVGVRDLISLCERLSLLDAMFEGERPPLVLDDPFTNLDEQTTARALSLVRDVAARYQVLYLTCHPSRMPKNSD